MSTGDTSTEVLPNPEPRLRRLVGGPLTASLRVRLETLTPLLGGSSEARTLDPCDAIRAPSIRGHLRFWWRALRAHAFETSEALAIRERELWGGMAKDAGTRSRVELRVDVESSSLSEDSSMPEGRGAYALWVAQSPRASRWRSKVVFWLQVRVPAEHLAEVELVLRAWVLWGGYGSRTRRGLGSLTVVDEREKWLPRQPSRAEWSRLFPGCSLFGSSSSREVRPVPSLCGARLLSGASRPDAEGAWTEALGWLREFRQGEGRSAGARTASLRKREEAVSAVAREPGTGRPGRSYWPEADKLRLLFKNPGGKPWAHVPRPPYSSPGAAWPRAGFGLPLAIRFQRSARPGEKGTRYDEPPDVMLKWHDGKKTHERLASPLIVKAMPLADGSFVPIALWLRRAWPDQGQVILSGRHDLVSGRESSAPFERLMAPGDTALYAPLREDSLEEAFLGWVKRVHGAKENP